MSFMYPRTVSISRSGPQAGEGKLGYGGETQADETPVAQDLPCNIELRTEGQRNATGLPGDGTRPTYDARIPRRALANGQVLDRDILIDDLGQRYLVVANYWNSLGYALRIERLEA